MRLSVCEDIKKLQKQARPHFALNKRKHATISRDMFQKLYHI